MADWLDIAAICEICVTYCILLPTLIYFCYQFNKIDVNSNVLKHRNQRLVNYMNILSVLSLIIEIPLEIFMNVFTIFTTYVTSCFFTWSVFILFVIKSWLLYYNFQYHLSLSKLTWKQEINPRYRSWYILHKNKCGNLSYCIRIIIIPFIIYNVIEIVLEYIFKTNLFVHSAIILSLLVLIPSFILYKRLKYITDTFQIKTELFYQQIIICILIFILLINSIVHTIIVNNSTTDRFQSLLNIIIMSMVIFSISFISTWHPVRLSEREMKFKTGSRYIHTQQQSVNNVKFGVKPLLRCIADPKGFNAFIRHLVQEFATENMLFVCEYIQIKHELQKKYKGLIKIRKTKEFNGYTFDNIDTNDEYIIIDFNIVHSDQKIKQPTIDIFNRSATTSVRRGHGVYTYLFTSDGNIWDIVKLPSGLPKAELLNQHDKFVDQLYTLFNKYIKTGSIHEINIPYPMRMYITNIINKNIIDENKEEKSETNIQYDEHECNLFNLIDDACIEIIHLMTHSYSRFAANIELNKKLKVLQRINSVPDEMENDNNNHGNKQNINVKELKPNMLRNGKSYNKLKQAYNLDDIETWPFYV
eukprot:530418_1